MKAETSHLLNFAKRYTAVCCSGDPASVEAFFSPNGSLNVNGVPAVGRSAITEVARGFMSAFPDMVLTMDDLAMNEEQVVFHWTLDGSNTGPGGTGKRVRISGFEEWELGPDDLIRASQGRFDEDEYQRQLKYGCDDLPLS